MANRRFEMHQCRQILSRMRLGETDRAIARAGLMGRRKAAALRGLAANKGWIDPKYPLPDDTLLAAHLHTRKTDKLQPSLGEPYAEEVTGWWKEGIQGTTIHAALVRKYGFGGSYSSVRRFLSQLKADHPDMTTILDFEPGEGAQVDFGKRPAIVDVYTGEIFRLLRKMDT